MPVAGRKGYRREAAAAGSRERHGGLPEADEGVLPRMSFGIDDTDEARYGRMQGPDPASFSGTDPHHAG